MVRVAIVACLCAIVAGAPRVANADPEFAEHVEAAAVGEDATMYHCRSRPESEPIVVTFKPDSELKDLVTWVMSFTCKNFVLDPRIVATGRKVTVIAPTKLTPAEAYRVFLVALSTIGLTVVEKGSVLVIVESATAKKASIAIQTHGVPSSSDQFVRYVVRPSFASADTLAKSLISIKSDAGDVQSIGALLLITDYASNVRDMMSLAALVDVPNSRDAIYTIPIQHADATKLGEKITQILGIAATTATAKPADKAAAPDAGADASVPSRLLIDERTNTLIIAASAPAYDRVKALVDRLDIALDIEGGTQIHIYQVGNAIAEELAVVLNAAIGTQPTKSATTTPTSSAQATAPSPLATASANSPSVPGADSTTLQGPARVIADKATNKLVVLSNGRDYLAIQNMIRELDEPRRQVYIEAAILEVTVDDASSLGASSHVAIPTTSGPLVLGGVQTGSLSTLGLDTAATATGSGGASSLATAQGLLAGVLGTALQGTALGTTIPSYGLLFQALATQANTNVLSTPSIIALDNEQAKYQVGTNIPYNNGASTTATGVSQTSIARQPLVLELDIKPHISANDEVLLEVKHEAQDLQTTVPLGPVWSTRSFETRLLVRDQETVVLGGLMQESESATVTKIPILGDIPLLGNLFKYTSKTKQKTNLLILLTPYIIKDSHDLAVIRERKQREHDEFLRAFGELSGMRYQPTVDYRKKRGLVEEINRAAEEIERQRVALDADARPRRVDIGRVDPAAPPVAPPTAPLER